MLRQGAVDRLNEVLLLLAGLARGLFGVVAGRGAEFAARGASQQPSGRGGCGGHPWVTSSAPPERRWCRT